MPWTNTPKTVASEYCVCQRTNVVKNKQKHLCLMHFLQNFIHIWVFSFFKSVWLFNFVKLLLLLLLYRQIVGEWCLYIKKQQQCTTPNATYSTFQSPDAKLFRNMQ